MTRKKPTRKKKAIKRAKAKKPAIDENLIVNAVVAIIRGDDIAQVLEVCDNNQAALDEARNRICQVAYADRELVLGTVIRRCNELYNKAIEADQLSVALGSQKELVRLLTLTDKAAQTALGDANGEGEGEVLRKIRGYLIPLKLASPDYPLYEHARIAADIVRGVKK